MSQSPDRKTTSTPYQDGWRAINLLIRSDGSWSGRERNVCYSNAGDGTFGDDSFLSGLDFNQDGRSFVPLDIDSDGDLDLIAKFRNGQQVRVLRNELGGRSLRVRLEGQAVGARALLKTNRRTLRRDVSAGSGFLSQPGRTLHFGLEEGETPDSLSIRWPGGDEQVVSPLPKAGLVSIAKGGSKADATPLIVEKLEATSATSAAVERTGTWLLEPVPAPDFQLEGLNGATSLTELKGGKSIVNFWATWCPPCREELADFAEHTADFERAGITPVAISVDDPAHRDKVKAFVAEHGLGFPVAFADDETVQVYTILNQHLFDRRTELAVPTTFLLDEQGRIVKVYRGGASAKVILRDARVGKGPALPFSYGTWHSTTPGRDYVEMASVMAERGLSRHARAYFEAQLAGGGSSPQLGNNLAALLIDEGKLDEAEALLRQSIVSAPKEPGARVNLGNVLLRKGDLGGARQALLAALELAPDDAGARSQLGSTLFAQGDLPGAEGEFRRTVELDATVAEYHFNLASVLAAQGRFGVAIEGFEAASERGMDTAEMSTSLAIAYTQSGMPANALLQFRHAVELEPEDPKYKVNLARYYMLSRNTSQARRLLDEVLATNPGFGPAVELSKQVSATGR